MAKTWFTADTHFGHSNIIKYCNRPFKTVEIMDAVLIRNWNARIKPHDLVMFLGDFAYKDKARVEDYLSKLHGHITFIKGNHDNNNSLDTRILDMTINIANRNFYCVHDPANASLKYKYVLVGHVHNKWKVQVRERSTLINVGVDVWNYSPVDINEILRVIPKSKVFNNTKRKERKEG